MFTHEQTLAAINAGLKAVGRPELPGIPKAFPNHSEKCVLGCAYGAHLMDYGESHATAEMQLPWGSSEDRDKIVAAWKEAGVECEAKNAHTIEFGGGLAAWMRAFDGGEWVALIVDGFDGERFHADEYPGETCIPVDQIGERGPREPWAEEAA